MKKLRIKTARKRIIPLALLLGLLLMMFSGGAALAGSGASNTSPSLVPDSPYVRPAQTVFETTGNIISLANPDEDYVEETELIDISDLSEWSTYDSISDGSLTVDFSRYLVKRSVPDNWYSWSSPPYSEETYPDIMFSSNSVTLSLSEPVSVFGFELEPNVFDTFNFTAKYYSEGNLVGSIKRGVAGYYGARLFAAQTKAGLFDKVVISFDGYPQGFCIGQFRYVIPEMKLSLAPNIYDQYIRLAARYYAGPLQTEGYKVGFIVDNKYVGMAYTDSKGYARIRYDISDLDPGVHKAYAKYGDIWASAKFVIGDYIPD